MSLIESLRTAYLERTNNYRSLIHCCQPGADFRPSSPSPPPPPPPPQKPLMAPQREGVDRNVVALPETVVHCAGRSLYHRIKTWFWRCLPAQHAERLPYRGRVFAYQLPRAVVAPQTSQVMRTAPRGLFMSRRTTRSGSSDQAPGTQPKPAKCASLLRAASRDSQPVAFFSPIPSMQTTLIPSTVRFLSAVPFSCTQ